MSGNFSSSALSVFLRERGYKATSARLAVLKFLQKYQRPISPKKISDQLAKKANQATVYRILKTFKKMGLVRQIDLQHDHTHFELIRPHDHHHHFVCQCCGRITDISSCNILNLINKIKLQSRAVGSISEHSLELFGRCRSCLNRQ